MFVRTKLNTSGSTSVQIISKAKGRYKVVKSFGSVEIDYEKYNYDQVWDGLKGYITNSQLINQEVIENYKNLWFVESLPDVKD